MRNTHLLLILLAIPFVLAGQAQLKETFIPPVLDSVSYADSVNEKHCEPQDLGDLFRQLFGKNKERKPRTQKKITLLILPNISSNPLNGFLLGVGGNLAWFFGARENTRISLIGFSAAVTSKQQFISFVKSNMYTNKNLFFLQGDLRYYIYKVPTYGLGTGSPPDSTDFDGNLGWMGAGTGEDGGYPMSYNYVKIHQIVSRKVANNFYAGLGYALDYYWNIVDDSLDIASFTYTPHYLYSREYEFDPGEYILSGLSLNLVYDSRDNQLNPYKGYYANINYRFNQTWLGSSQNSSSLWMEFRTYVGLSKKTPRHLIAFWLFGDFKVSGHRPFFTLMATGEDQKGRSGRGYIAGRYRGENVMYGEVEYRFPISQCSQILGGVIFLNATTASNLARADFAYSIGQDLAPVRLFDVVRPGFGFGLRFMINKYTRLNLNLDFGIGIDSKGFYFSGTETF